MKSDSFHRAALLILLITSPTFAKHIEDKVHSFSFDIPDTFAERALRSKRPENLYAFEQSNPPMDLLIYELPGTIGQDNGSLAVEIARQGGKSFVVPWKSFELIGFEAPAQQIGTQKGNFSVQLPLVPHAIQVTVLGSSLEGDRLKALLIQVIGSVEGQTNWLPWGMSWLKPLAVAVGLVAIIAAFLFGRRKKPR